MAAATAAVAAASATVAAAAAAATVAAAASASAAPAAAVYDATWPATDRAAWPDDHAARPSKSVSSGGSV